MHYHGIFDDRQRMICIICHNTDNGDGWEREGESDYYFHEFSEKKPTRWRSTSSSTR